MISNQRIRELLLEYNANTLEELIDIIDTYIEKLIKDNLLMGARFLDEVVR